jgi:anti-anti-sigma factor
LPSYLIKYLISLGHSSSALSYGGSVIGHEHESASVLETRGLGADVLTSEVPRAGIVQADFSLALERDGGNSAVLVLAGELDLFRLPAIADALAEVRCVTVDLRLVTFIDATTLGLLLSASRRQQAHGAELIVLVGPKTPMIAFEATGVDRLLTIKRLDDEPTDIAAGTANGEWTRLSPPPHTTLKRRNSNGNNGNH